MEPEEVFYGLVRYYSSLGIDDEINWSAWSLRTLSYFDNLGRMLGYQVDTEDTYTKDDEKEWEIPKELRGKRIDMIWKSVNDGVYKLALEHQGRTDPSIIKLDIKKLMHIEGLRVLILYNQNPDKVEGWLLKSIKKYNMDGLFMLITFPDYFTTKKNTKKLIARLYNSAGKITGEGTAEGRMESNTGLLFFSGAKWRKINTN